jgi:thiosulfate reductase cytochrome b subunit
MTKHHLLVRISHWLTLPLLIGLIMSGLSIYWAAPVYRPGFSQAFYDRFSFGRQILATALGLHWLFAYLFMLCGLLYLAGLIAGGGWRALMRRGAFSESLAMVRYYSGVIPMRLRRKPWPLEVRRIVRCSGDHLQEGSGRLVRSCPPQRMLPALGVGGADETSAPLTSAVWSRCG